MSEFNFIPSLSFRINSTENYYKNLEFKLTKYYYNKEEELNNIRSNYYKLYINFTLIYGKENIQKESYKFQKSNFKNSILKNNEIKELIDINKNMHYYDILLEILYYSKSKEDYEMNILQFEFSNIFQNNFISY